MIKAVRSLASSTLGGILGTYQLNQLLSERWPLFYLTRNSERSSLSLLMISREAIMILWLQSWADVSFLVYAMPGMHNMHFWLSVWTEVFYHHKNWVNSLRIIFPSSLSGVKCCWGLISLPHPGIYRHPAPLTGNSWQVLKCQLCAAQIKRIKI